MNRPTLTDVGRQASSGLKTAGRAMAATETTLGVAALGAAAGGIGYGIYKLFGGNKKRATQKLSGKAIGK